jgi:putative intracellular protease/amidase
MADNRLAGKKIAVLVESQYLPAEIRCYQERFGSYGAEVHLVSNLWGQPSQTFVSEVEVAGRTPETLEVSLDLETIDPDDYCAVIMAANYPSVRLRWNEAAISNGRPSEATRRAPAVNLFRRLALDTRIVKGAPCHALWLLTPSPDHLAGRRVTCNPVVLADVLNAGARYVPPPEGTNWWEHVVVDGDLVTSMSAVHDDQPLGTERLVDAIRDRIVALDEEPPQPAAVPARTIPSGGGRRRILVLLSEWGFWGEELVGPLGEFARADYQVDFCTPNGRRPNAIPVSMDPEFFDPPLQRPVTSREMAARTREIDDPSTPQGKRLDNPINLADWYPRRPYFAASQFVRLLENYNRERERADREIEKYDSLLIVGGSGPIVDLANNQRVHDLILAFLAAGKPIGAECYGVACLVFARDLNLRQSIIRGKHVTGHCLEYDYQDGTSFVRARNEFLDFNMGPPPYPLEFLLRDATGPDGGYHGNFGHPTSVVVDYPFITGRSTSDSVLTGQKMIEVLDGQPPLRRWGW